MILDIADMPMYRQWDDLPTADMEKSADIAKTYVKPVWKGWPLTIGNINSLT